MKVFKTAVSALALSAALAACEAPRPQYPVRLDEGAPPPPPVQAAPPPAPAPPPAASADGATPQARPTTGVQSQSLPPPPGARSSRQPGAALDPRYRQDGLFQLAAYAPGDDAVVYPAARKHHAKAKAAEAETATVQKGDTLATIAKAHGTTIEDLAKLNGLKSPYRLTAGDTIKLPGKAAAAAPAPESDAVPAKGKPAAKAAKAPEAATVGKGDTLASIARKSGVSVEDLAKLNGLKAPYRLKIGQTIQLAESAPAEEPAPSKGKAPQDKSQKGKAAKAEAPASDDATSTITVRRKDTIQSLAKQAKTSVEALARLNHLKKPYHLKPGQQLQLPDQAGPGASSSGGRNSDALAREIASSAPKHASAVIAGRRDTLQSIARKEGVTVEELARLNGLKKPYRIHRGQKIKLPVKAEVPEAPASRASYQVKKGDTLYSIARRFGTDARTLAELNGMEPGGHLNLGRRIRLPGSAEDKAAPKPEPARPPRARDTEEPDTSRAPPPAPVPSRQPAQPVPYNSLPNPVAPAPGVAPPPTRLPPVQPAPGEAPASGAAPAPYRPTAPAPEPTTPADADVAAAGKGLFQWPARGQVLQAFGPMSGGQRNDGLDIGAVSGDPVRSAAAGEVVYAGSSVPGFGNLVLIRHDGGWVTAYAHLANIDVKMRQAVTQGQQIGEVGMTGGVSQPQLHFEIRYSPTAKDKARPIDPALVLPPQ